MDLRAKAGLAIFGDKNPIIHLNQTNKVDLKATNPFHFLLAGEHRLFKNKIVE